MAPKLTRRQFLKLSGFALLVSGCTLDLQEEVWMEPYVRPPEETLPGEDLWFASTCRMCPAGCGIVVRVSNGRARKIEGNPEHPLNGGRLCARGQAGLQLLYHPDRVRQILRRLGGRGEGAWGTLSWDQAIRQLADELRGLDPARIAFLTGVLPDPQRVLVERFAQGLGAPPPVVYDTQALVDGVVPLQKAAEALFGASSLPFFDLARADLVLTFGSHLLETELSPVAYGRAYGRMRGRPEGRGILVAVDDRLSATAARADLWVPVAPGTEGLVALALGRRLLERVGEGRVPAAVAGLYADVDPEALAARAGAPLQRLERLVDLLLEVERPLAVPGGRLGGYVGGWEAVAAVLGLNALLDRLGKPGGVYLSPAAPARDLRPGSVSPFAEVAALVERMHAGEVDALWILGANPAYELPAALDFVGALEKVRQVVTFPVLMDETAERADWVLPAHTYLETWGYQFIRPGPERVVVGAQQPVVRPLYDTRDPGDVLLALADALGGKVKRRLPWPNLVAFLRTRLTSLIRQEGNVRAADPEAFWTLWLQHGGWWSAAEAWQAPELRPDLSLTLTPRAPEEDGEFPLFLEPIPSVAFGDGRHAGLPWLQELPDPMTTVAWETWAELHPETAARLGVEDGEVVRIASPHGTVQAVAYLNPALHPQAVAVPLGQGHTALGRWARGRGSNVLALLAPEVDPETGQLAWRATRVRVEGTGRKVPLPRLESNVGVDRARREDRVVK